MIVLAPLNLIDDNPYQTRQHYDPTAIQSLADSIVQLRPSRPDTCGLIHVPPARCLDVASGTLGMATSATMRMAKVRFQLAAGHSRLRAFRLLAEQDPQAWTIMPVDVAELDDQAMADIIWQENMKRRDLSAVEEAAALRQAITQFGYTQAAIGQRWGLSQSAVANKLRLLDLPEPAQAAIRNGQISERHGRVLLTAQARSPVLYERLAGEILPLPAPDNGHLDKAKELLASGHWFNNSAVTPGPASHWICSACGQDVDYARFRTVYQCNNSYPAERSYLCQACYRSASGWMPPTAAGAEDKLNELMRSTGRHLREAIWPMEMVVGQGDYRIHDPRCDKCDRHVVVQENWAPDLCLDDTCFAAKRQNWTCYLEAQLRAAIGDDHPVTIITDTSGEDLTTLNEADALLVHSGQCRKCERHRFRFYDVKNDSHHIYAVLGLPYIYNCNNSQSQRACAKRALATLRTEDQVQADRSREAAIVARKKAGDRLMTAAARAIAQALADDNLETWRALALRLGIEKPRLKELEGTVHVQYIIADNLLRSQVWEADWKDAGAPDHLREQLAAAGAKLGVSLIAEKDRLEARLARLERWVEDDAADATELIQSNCANLDKLLAACAGALAKDDISQGEYSALAERIAACAARLEGISREIPEDPPEPCVWDDGAEEHLEEAA